MLLQPKTISNSDKGVAIYRSIHSSNKAKSVPHVREENALYSFSGGFFVEDPDIIGTAFFPQKK